MATLYTVYGVVNFTTVCILSISGPADAGARERPPGAQAAVEQHGGAADGAPAAQDDPRRPGQQRRRRRPGLERQQGQQGVLLQHLG